MIGLFPKARRAGFRGAGEGGSWLIGDPAHFHGPRGAYSPRGTGLGVGR